MGRIDFKKQTPSISGWPNDTTHFQKPWTANLALFVMWFCVSLVMLVNLESYGV